MAWRLPAAAQLWGAMRRTALFLRGSRRAALQTFSSPLLLVFPDATQVNGGWKAGVPGPLFHFHSDDPLPQD